MPFGFDSANDVGLVEANLPMKTMINEAEKPGDTILIEEEAEDTAEDENTSSENTSPGR